MRGEIWTTETLLEFLQREYNDFKIYDKDTAYSRRISSVLKAFDLYVDKEFVFSMDENGNKIKKKYIFCFSDFIYGDFIKERSEEEVESLLIELVGSEIWKKTRADYSQFPIMDVYFYLCRIFSGLFVFSAQLQKNIAASQIFGPISVVNSLILNHSVRIVRFEAERMKEVLLKIIGDKKPVAKSVLINEYGYEEEI